MKLSQEQFDALAPYQKHFETAVKAQWTRNPGSVALDLIFNIYVQVTGSTEKLNKGCNHCIMRLMTDMGRIFLEDLEERKKVVVAKEETSTSEPIKAEVKIKRKYTRKPKTQE